MRKTFANLMEQFLNDNKMSIFITGDLGYNALEGVQKVGQKRFINAGVAEQNMVGVAAGFAYSGFEVFTYSIAPFAVYRCFEQIKIDVCIHNLPVYIVGNGGGYGYGIMGATHHAIEDIACLSSLPNMVCWIPAFNEDIEFCLTAITDNKNPAYLRLGLGGNYPNKIKISLINKLISSNRPKITIIAIGPIVHNVIKASESFEGIEVFTILRIPIINITEELRCSILNSKKVIIVEEHVERGGCAEHLLSVFTREKINNIEICSIHAKGYPSKLYGNQAFHQQESGLDVNSIQEKIKIILQ